MRRSENLTQGELANKLSISRSAIAQIESSNNNPSRNLILNLLEVFVIAADLRKELTDYVNGNKGISKVSDTIDDAMPIEAADKIWGEREIVEKVGILIGLKRSPSHKPISVMEAGEYEYFIRSNESLFSIVPNLALELSNFFNQHKFGHSEITYMDFQQFGFKVTHFDSNWCKFYKRTNDSEISGKFYFKDSATASKNHLMISNWVNNEGENCFNGTIHSKKFLFEVLVSIGCMTSMEVSGL